MGSGSTTPWPKKKKGFWPLRVANFFFFLNGVRPPQTGQGGAALAKMGVADHSHGGPFLLSLFFFFFHFFNYFLKDYIFIFFYIVSHVNLNG
jgi:hypothetical protein